MASPISAQQASEPQESRLQFGRRMYSMECVLKAAGSNTYSFYRRVTKSMATKVMHGPYAYALEFPQMYLNAHSKKFGRDVDFVMKYSEETWQAWPIRLTLRTYEQSKARVFAYGAGGWKTFLDDNRIKVGDYLIFTLLEFSVSGFSAFGVDIERAPVEELSEEDSEFRPENESVDSDDSGDEEVSNGDEQKRGRRRSPRRRRFCLRRSLAEGDDANDEAGDSSDDGITENEGDMDIEDEDEDEAKGDADQAPLYPYFRVAVPPSSHPRHVSLTVPGRFWDLHGDMLRSNEVQLRGPGDKAIFKVRVKRSYDVNKEECLHRLKDGWKAFLDANKLRVGDVLEFYLVQKSCLIVDLSLEPIEEH